jgi:hypothetical protein
MGDTRKETKLIRFIRRALRIIKKARIPLRASKFSNNIYNNHVHLILHMLRFSTQMSYIRFFEWIENFTKLWLVLGLASIPHFTTLQKFTARCPKPYLDHFILISGLNQNKDTRTASLDSTGYSLTNASYYYSVMIKTRQKTRSGRPRSRRLIKRYLKVTFLVDVHYQTILAVSIRRGPDNDNNDFVRSFSQIERNGSINIGMVLADKGYDFEANHEYIHDVIGADTIIPARQSMYDD